MTTLAEKYINRINDLEDQKGEHDEYGDRGRFWFWDQIRKIADYVEDKSEADEIAFSDGSVLMWREDWGKWV